MTAPAARRGNWFTRGGWWFLVHVLSLGVLAAVPFTHAATVSRRRAHAALAAAVTVGTVLWIVLAASAPRDSTGRAYGPVNAIAALVFFLLLVGGVAALIVLRRQVYGAGAPATDPALARALAGRQRRTEARRLVAEDPLLARELRIGRPDLPREYDDGGLVDLNAAPAPAIADVCGLDPTHAGRIVQARQAAGRFGSVEDVFSWTELPVETWDRIRDRAVTL
ncbi:helix-hairpin-helix domain-containing protein [Actinomycetospora soli]|uniref:helix-hairpin-helix domain-containing protein n=1 Tax=Actinomycetospora soli TaxID=2893887 RepID=UPI001E4071B0|nr:helix-hairpin-helix domain-containing protein [Actinomycetospora soli]MCD2186800.1 helix-hairpin-helix domain-containing protein [Actinomycetospora soli]